VFRPPSGDEELRHGYTVSQVRALSLAVVTRQTWYQSVDFDQRLEVAWHAIIEHLYTADEPPAMPDMAHAADQAVGRDIAQTHRFYGRRTGDRYTGFERYWHTIASHGDSPEITVTDRVALAQIWPRLRPLSQQALAALTDHDDYGLAAQALGMSRAHFRDRISTARRDFLRLWHEGEPPSRPWAYDLRGGRAVDPLTSANRTIAARRRAHGKLRRPAPPGGGRPRKDLGITDAELARRYQEGQSIRQIAASLDNIHYNVVRVRLIAHGVQLRRANGRPARETPGAANEKTRTETAARKATHIASAVPQGHPQ
jgi:hypothetical protein